MKISTSTAVLAQRFGIGKAIEKISNAGFDAFDLSLYCSESNLEKQIYGDNYRDFIDEAAESAKRNNITCCQAHSVYPTQKYGESKEYNCDRLFRLKRGMEIASALDCAKIVIHPIHLLPKEIDAVVYNAVFFQKLIPYCEAFNIRICIENIARMDEKRNHATASVCGNPKEHKKLIDTLNSEWITGCVDVGHAALSWYEPEDFLRELGHRVGALHIQDNDYINDSHTIPYLGKIEWKNVMSALKDIGYTGYFNYEADNFLKRFPDEMMDNVLKFMCDVGRNVVNC